MSENEFLATLAYSVRLLTEEQVRKHFIGPGYSGKTSRWLGRFKGSIETERVMMPRPLQLTAPLIDWRVGDSLPNFGRVAWKLKARGGEMPIATTIVKATEKTKSLYGSLSTRSVRPAEHFHDACVAELYLYFRSERPNWKWTHEDQLGLENSDRPDALLSKENETIFIDVGGRSYDARRLRAMHAAFCHVRYQLY